MSFMSSVTRQATTREPDPLLAEQFEDKFKPDTSSVFGAQFRFAKQQVGTLVARTDADFIREDKDPSIPRRRFVGKFAGITGSPIRDSDRTIITQEEYEQSEDFRDDLEYYPNMSAEAAKILARRSDIRKEVDFLAAKATGFQNLLGLVGGIAGFATDPVTIIASALPLPGLNSARVAQVLGKSVVGRRFKIGAIQGAFGETLITPGAFADAEVLEEDFTMMDAIFNIGVGILFGGSLNVGGGFIGDKITSRNVSEEIISEGYELGMRQMINSNPVDVEFHLGDLSLKELEDRFIKGQDITLLDEGPSAFFDNNTLPEDFIEGVEPIITPGERLNVEETIGRIDEINELLITVGDEFDAKLKETGFPIGVVEKQRKRLADFDAETEAIKKRTPKREKRKLKKIEEERAIDRAIIRGELSSLVDLESRGKIQKVKADIQSRKQALLTEKRQLQREVEVVLERERAALERQRPAVIKRQVDVSAQEPEATRISVMIEEEVRLNPIDSEIKDLDIESEELLPDVQDLLAREDLDPDLKVEFDDIDAEVKLAGDISEGFRLADICMRRSI